MNFRILRRFIWRRDTREVRNLSGPSLLVESLWVTLLCFLNRDINEYFNEGDGIILALAGCCMEIARNLAVRDVGRDERRQGDGGGVCKELRNLSALYQHSLIPSLLLLCTLSHEQKRHTSAIRLIFSFRSFSENPKSLFKPNRTLSPSNLYAASPRCSRCCSSAVAIVDFPEAERPVNQIVKPRCFRSSLRSWREREGCQVMLLCSLVSL